MANKANFEEILLNRRSIRRYTPQKIKPEIITKIIKAGMYAPSAVNKKPWHFIVIEEKQTMESVMKIHANAKMLREASHAILVCGDENLQHDDGFWIADCGAATQNILLSAFNSDIGSCWIGIYPREERMKAVSKIFNLPGHVRPFALVALGYPAEVKKRPERFDEKKVHYGKWGNGQ